MTSLVCEVVFIGGEAPSGGVVAIEKRKTARECTMMTYKIRGLDIERELLLLKILSRKNDTLAKIALMALHEAPKHFGCAWGRQHIP